MRSSLASTPSPISWNDEYQARVSAWVDATRSQSSGAEGAELELTRFIGLFATFAEDTGRAIIDELHLPLSSKSHTPKVLPGTDEEVYVVDSVIFSLTHPALSRESSSSSAHPSEKDDAFELCMARIEMSAVDAVLNARILGLASPLMALVEYRGFSMVAVTTLPVSPQTVVTPGSGLRPDDEARVDALLASLASELNLVLPPAPRKGAPPHVHGPRSAITHVGKDKRVYAVSLQKLFPPDLPSGESAGDLAKVLPPALVSASEIALNANAFAAHLDGSGKGSDVSDLMAVSTDVRDVLIPRLASALDSLQVICHDSDSLHALLATTGIESRFLGALYSHATLPHTRALLGAEMVALRGADILARSLRRVVMSRRLLLESGITSVSSRPKAVAKEMAANAIDFYNLVVGTSDESHAFWSTVLLPDVAESYGVDVDPSAIPRPALLYALESATGFLVRHSPAYDYRSPCPLAEDSDVLGWVATVRTPVPSCLTAPKEEYARLLSSEGRSDSALLSMDVAVKASALLHGFSSPRLGPKYAAMARYAATSGAVDHALALGGASVGVSPSCHAATGMGLTAYLSGLLAAGGDPDHALEVYQAALESISHHWTAFNPLLLDVHETMGGHHAARGDPLLALSYYQAALDLATKSLGTNHERTAAYYHHVGHLSASAGLHGAAVNAYERALLIHDRVLGPDAPTTSHSMYYLSEALYTKGMLTRALDLAKQGLLVRTRLYPVGHPLVIDSAYQVAYTANALDDCDSALPAFEQLLSHLQDEASRLGALNPQIGPDADALSAVLAELKSITMAIVHLVFRTLPPQHTLLLTRAQEASSTSRHTKPIALGRAMDGLLSKHPATYVRDVFTRMEMLSPAASDELLALIQVTRDDTILVDQNAGAGAISTNPAEISSTTSFFHSHSSIHKDHTHNPNTSLFNASTSATFYL